MRSIGRYLQPDTLAVARPGWDQPLYAYGLNNPLGWYDVLGLACVGPTLDITGFLKTLKHKLSESPRENTTVFHLTCPTCETVINIHPEYGYFTGLLSSPTEPAISFYSTVGANNDKWVMGEVRSRVVLAFPSPDIKACYDCKKP